MNAPLEWRRPGNWLGQNVRSGLILGWVWVVWSALAFAQDPGRYQAIPLENVRAEQVERVIAPLLPPGTELVADQRGNRILVRGSLQSQQLAQRAVKSLDQVQAAPTAASPSSVAEPVLKVYSRPSGTAGATAARLQGQFGQMAGVRIVADDRTSQVLVLAPPEMQAKIAASFGDVAGGPGVGMPDAARPAPEVVQPVPAADFPVREMQLRRATAEQVESALASMFGDRLARVPSHVPTVALYRLRLSDGSEVGLTLDRPANRATFAGPAPAAASVAQLIRALDSVDLAADQSMRLLPLKTTRAADVKRTVAAIRTSNAAREPGVGGSPTADRGSHLAAQLLQPTRTADEGVAQAPGATAPAPGGPDRKGPPSGAPPKGALPGAPPADEAGGGLIGPVQIEMLEGLDVLVIRGNRRDVQQVVEIIEQIEKLSAETEPAIEVLPLTHADCSAMSTLVLQLYTQVYQARQGTVTILPLVKPNSLLVVGRQENVDRVISLVKLLDTPVSPDAQFQVFRLKHATAGTVQTMIEGFYTDRGGLGPVVRVTSDLRSNALVVQAAPRDLAEVAAMIAKIDTPDSDAVNELRVFKLSHTLAADLARTLSDAIQTQITAQAGAAPGAAATTQAARTGSQRSSMLQFVDVDGHGQRRLSSGILTEVRITSDTRANTLIVSAPSDSMPLIEAVIKQLDHPPAVRAEIKVFTVLNGDSESLVGMLGRFFGQPTTGAAGTAAQPTLQSAARETESSLVPLRFEADPRTNSIIASGTASDLIVVEAMLRMLDAADVKNRQNIVYRLKNAPASDVALAINDLLRTARQVEVTLESPFEQIEREVVVVPEPVSNSLIVSATPRYFEDIKKLIEELDQRPPMVVIQVLIAEVQLNNTDEFGVELGLQDGLLFKRGLPPDPGFLFNGAQIGNTAASNVQSQYTATQGTSNFGLGRTNGQLSYGGLVLTASSESVSVLLRALKERRKTEVLARPQIMTLDNQTAYIQVGQLVPSILGVSLTQYGQTNNVQYQETGLILGVTPRISPDGLVVMEIDANQSDVGPEAEGIPISVATNGTIIRSPRINRILAQTVVSASSGQTVVLGGLISRTGSHTARTVPYLSDIPVVGALFRFDSKQAQRRELLIFMTPHVIKSTEDADTIKRVEAARMHWCLADVIEVGGDIGVRSRTDEWSDSETPTVYPDGNPRMPNGQSGASPGSGAPTPAPMPAPERTPQMLESPPGPGAKPGAPAGGERKSTSRNVPTLAPPASAQGRRPWPTLGPRADSPPAARGVQPAVYDGYGTVPAQPIDARAQSPVAPQLPAVYYQPTEPPAADFAAPPGREPPPGRPIEFP